MADFQKSEIVDLPHPRNIKLVCDECVFVVLVITNSIKLLIHCLIV